MAKSRSFKVPTRESEDKRAREEDAAAQRLEEHGRSILTMWMLGHVIQHNRQDFQLSKESITIIATFSNFTNQTGSGLDLTEDDMQILRDFAEEIKREYFHNNVEVHEGINCRDLWKSFLQAYWTSDGFLRFEAKFAPKLVLPFFKRDDGATLVLSDNLFLLDKLTKFLKELSMLPTLPQRMSSFYASSGLTVNEKAKLLFSRKQEDHMKHQLKIASAKVTRATDELKEAKEKDDFLQMLMERMRVQNKDYADQIDSMQKEIKASRIAIEKFCCGDSLPMCNVCNELYIGKASPLKIAGCCGNLLCSSCFDQIKKINYAHHGDTPPCPSCRAPVICLVPIIDDHPTIRNFGRKLKANAETSFDQDVSLEAQIGGSEIEPILTLKPSRPPSIYAQLLLAGQDCAGGGGGGGAARPNPHHRRDPPAARRDA
jgi:hypothetical protein